MSEFYNLLDEYVGEQESVADVRAVIRRLWFYDFADYPLRVWQGKGKLFTSDGNEWLGTIDSNDNDHHKTPSMKDGRDGSSARSTFSIDLIDTPGVSAKNHYEQIRHDKSLVYGRKLTCYLAIFKLNEGLRPQTPIIFFKEYIMMNPKFSEKMEISNGIVIQKYNASVIAKDGNFGRSEIPNGTYANSIQQERARQLGVNLDLGSQYLASLANRTYVVP